MPNHVINKVVISGKIARVKSLLETIRNTENESMLIDFNKIDPMPEELKTVTSPVRIISEDSFANEMIDRNNRLKTNPDDLISQTHSITQKMYDEYMSKYGCSDWYDWSTRHWGTKWNAYQQSKGEPETDEMGNHTETIFFQTAWSTPFPVMKKLSEQFPDVDIHVTFADEDAGSNCGMYSLYDGEEVDETYLPDVGSTEAMSIYFELWGGEEDWVLDDNGEYQLKDEDEDE